MKSINREPILITGVERSGSTIIAKIIASCGVHTGNTTNMLENIKIKHFMDEYYDFIGADPRGQFPLPLIRDMFIPHDWAEHILENIGWPMAPWLYKSSRICQTWPVWLTAFPRAKYVVVRRRTGDIVQSCMKTGYMTAFNDKETWLWWVHQHERRFMEMLNPGFEVMHVWPERMVVGNYDQVFAMLKWLGLPYDEDKIKTLVEPMIWKSKLNGKN